MCVLQALCQDHLLEGPGLKADAAYHHDLIDVQTIPLDFPFFNKPAASTPVDGLLAKWGHRCVCER